MNTPQEVRGIFRDVYNMYLEYKNMESPYTERWIDFHADMRILIGQYPGGLCETMVNAILKDILENARERAKLREELMK